MKNQTITREVSNEKQTSDFAKPRLGDVLNAVLKDKLRKIEYQSWSDGNQWTDEQIDFIIAHNCICDNCTEHVESFDDFPELDFEKSEFLCEDCHKEQYYKECGKCQSLCHPDEIDRYEKICDDCLELAVIDESVVLKIINELISNENGYGMRGHFGICTAVAEMIDSEFIELPEYLSWVKWFDAFKPKVFFDKWGNKSGENYEFWFNSQSKRRDFLIHHQTDLTQRLEHVA